MKYLKLGIILCSFLACNQAVEDQGPLYKTWKVVEIEMEGYSADILAQVINAGVYYQFNDDMTYLAVINGDQRNGTYELNDETGEITTTDSNGDVEVSNLEDLSDDRMVWVKGPNRMVFEPSEQNIKN